MEFFPRSDWMLVAVGDKMGQIGFWNFNKVHAEDFVSIVLKLWA